MIVGIVSDSHGKTKRLTAALEMFSARGAEMIVHCGDIGSPECVELLGSAPMPAYAVSGNMDRNVNELEAAAQRVGVAFSRRHLEAPVGKGKCLAVTHGDDGSLLEELIRCGRYSYVCHGHTHRRRDERRGSARVINPGSLRFPSGSWHPTVAILDTEADTVEHLRVR
ncbi:MAG: metallophosphoesterase family protein [Planctomycetota bacterium]|jgi:putative phosphoesterase